MFGEDMTSADFAPFPVALRRFVIGADILFPLGNLPLSGCHKVKALTGLADQCGTNCNDKSPCLPAHLSP